MDWMTALAVGIPAAVAVIGWFLAHELNGRREHANRKREARVQALQRAFLRLAGAANRPLTEPIRADLELFVSEIQLYGTPRHIELTAQLVKQFCHPPENGTVNFDPLLESLRDCLRSELALEPVAGHVWWLRLADPMVRANPPIEVASNSAADSPAPTNGPANSPARSNVPTPNDR